MSFHFKRRRLTKVRERERVGEKEKKKEREEISGHLKPVDGLVGRGSEVQNTVVQASVLKRIKH